MVLFNNHLLQSMVNNVEFILVVVMVYLDLNIEELIVELHSLAQKINGFILPLFVEILL